MIRSRGVLVAVVLLALAAGGYVFQLVQGSRQESAAIRQLLADVATEVGKPVPDSSELSALATRIRKVEGHEANRELRVALARIDIARGREDQALRELEPLVLLGDGTGEELQLTAWCLLRSQQRGGDLGKARKALDTAEAAYARSSDPVDLRLALQAAIRLQDDAAKARVVELLSSRHADTRDGRFALLVRDFTETTPPAEVAGVLAEFERPPEELALLQVVQELQGGRPAEALRMLDPLLQSAPALLDVRNFAAYAYHLLAAAPGTAPAEQATFLLQRDAHLDWLLQAAPPEDARRKVWAEMRAVR